MNVTYNILLDNLTIILVVSFTSLILVVGILTMLIQRGVIQWKKCLEESQTLSLELVRFRYKLSISIASNRFKNWYR